MTIAIDLADKSQIKLNKKQNKRFFTYQITRLGVFEQHEGIKTVDKDRNKI